MPDGQEIDWYYSDVPESVMVVPVTASGNVVLVKQYRYNLKLDTLECRQERSAGVSPRRPRPLANWPRRPVMLHGVRFESLGRFYSLPSETNKWANYFLACPVVASVLPTGDSEIEKYFDMSVVEMPFAQALEAVGGVIHGIETAGALMLAAQHLAQ